MEKIEQLEELYNKYNKNSKISKPDKEYSKSIITELLEQDENKNKAMQYVILFPEDIGIQSYLEYLKKLDANSIEKANQMFIETDVFKSNSSGRSINRGTYLVGIFCDEKLFKEAIFILKELLKMINTNKNSIPDKTIEVFRKNIFKEHYNEFFRINIDDINEKDFYKLKEIILHSSFKEIKGESLKPIVQFGALHWLTNQKNNYILYDIEKEMIEHSLRKWPYEMIELLRKDENLMKIYCNIIPTNKINIKNDLYLKETSKNYEICGIYEDTNIVNTVINDNENVDKIIEKPNDYETKNDNISNEKSSEKSDLKKILKLALSETEKLDKQLNKYNLRIEELKNSLNLIQKMYEDKNAENDKLNLDIKLLKDNTKVLEDNNSKLWKKIDIYETEMENINLEFNESKEKLAVLLNVNSNEYKSELNEYINKLGAKLKYLYTDFKEIENYNMSDKFGENLRDQIREIFNILISQGIKL